MSRHDVSHWFEYGIHYQTATIDCTGDIDEDLASRVVRGLWALDPQGRPITVLLTTGGGCELSGMKIYDAIRRCNSEVTVLGTGEVMSMGVLILQAGDRRLLTPHCTVMLHEGSVEVPDDHRRNAKAYMSYMERNDKVLDRVLLDRIREVHPGYTQRQLTSLQTFDCYLTAQETIALGLADGTQE